MRQRKNHTTTTDRILNAIFSMRAVKVLIFVSLVAIYPSSVADGMLQTIDADVHLRIPIRYNTHGLDISHHNGEIDWEKVSHFDKHLSSVKFCFIKATEGADLIDSQFAKNWKSLKNQGIRRGAYHFFNTSSDPRLQALNYILTVKFEKGDFVPVLDWEDLGRGNARREIEKNVKIWLDVIERHYGVKPIIYTNSIIYRKYIIKHFPEYPLWISHYNVPELQGYDLSKVYFWQYSMHGNVEGIETLVDFNVFLKDDFDFERITFRQ